MKTGVTCGEFKPIDQFNFRNKMLGRRWGTCKSCQSEQRRRWYEDNKETHNLRNNI